MKKLSHFVQEIVFGANDGIVTTFAVTSSLVGAGIDKSFNPLIVLILGVANLLADGSSMGLGNFLSLRASTDLVKNSKENSIFHSAIHGLFTFFSFCIFGCIPLLPFLLFSTFDNLYLISVIFTFISFIVLGIVRNRITKKSLLLSITENLLVGVLAATIAFGFGFGFRTFV
jgi:vacuolar iron transporter family protein